MSRSLHVLSDAQGTVSLGFLAANVYYFKAAGFLCAKLGIDCSLWLRKQLPTARVSLFFDASESEGFAFAARSAITRAFVANRPQLDSITVLALGGAAAPARS